jgi:hypothetical protein
MTRIRRMDAEGTTIQTPQTGAQVTTTTTQTKQDSLWSALFHFAVDSNCNIDYLRGAKGGYVNAVSLAVTNSDFIARVFQAMGERQLTLIDFSKVKHFSVSDPPEKLSQEWKELAKKAIAHGDVQFTEFQLYDEE